jgi:hypothetical protein
VELAMGIFLVWLGAALLWVAFHGTTAKTPWEIFQSVVTAATGGGAGAPAAGAPAVDVPAVTP